MSDLTGLQAIGYCRISTDDKGQTVETQKRHIESWATQNGVTIKAIYADEGVSGNTFPRPQLSLAIVDAVSSHVPILVCYDQSRLTRNGAEHLPIIKKMLGSTVIRYTSLDIDPDNLGGRLMSAVKSVTDSEERAILRTKTKIGMETRKLQGKHVGRPARFLFKEEIATAPTGLYKAGVTVVMAMPVVMAYADAGLSIRAVAKDYLGINSATLHDALVRADLLNEYLDRKNKAKQEGWA